jgi:hypothetical protein
MDCGATLEPGLSPPLRGEEGEPNARFLPVRVFRGLHAQFQAELARNVLLEEGIPSTIIGDLGAEMLPGADAVQLLVREEDHARASQLVQAFLESEVEPEEPSQSDAQKSQS